MRHISMVLLISAGIALAGIGNASAKDGCPEGKTASGACINPHLAKLMRHQTILMTQPKISYTAPLVMPGDDEAIQPPRQIFETNALAQDPFNRR